MAAGLSEAGTSVACSLHHSERRPSERLVPPAPKPPAAGGSAPGFVKAFRALRALRTNGLTVWATRAYEELLIHRRYLGTDCYLVSDPEAVHHVLSANSDNYQRPLGIRRLFGPWMGCGLVLAEGAEWRSQRRRLSPAFGPRHIEGLLPRLTDAGGRMLGRLDESRGANFAGMFLDVAIDVLGHAIFSFPLDRYADRIDRLHRAYFTFAIRVTLLDYLARHEGDFFFGRGLRARLGRQLHGVVDELIAVRRSRTHSGGTEPDLMELLLAARDADTGAPLPMAEMRDQVATMLAVGYDTTARLMFWATYLLSRDQDEQARVRHELAGFTPEAVRSLEDLRRWPRLICVLMETLRLYPPVQGLVRVARGPDQIGGLAVRTGSVVAVCPWVIHRHRALWDDPDVFMPERFANSARGNPSDYTYIPFGVGPRVCIGNTFAMTEAMLILAQLFERYHVVLDDDRPVMPTSIVTTAPNIEPTFRLTRTG